MGKEITAMPGQPGPEAFKLGNGSRVAVLGGGPAGAFFSYFFLETSSRVDLHAHVDIYEPKNFSQIGPGGCNMCGGIISESLVQLLATEGINLPSNVVQRGIDSYVLHMDAGAIRIDPSRPEKRIAAVHRGSGPRTPARRRWDSFDGHLLGLATKRGAHLIPERVEDIRWLDGKPCLTTRTGESEGYDLLVMAAGVNGATLRKLFSSSASGYIVPQTTRTGICELALGEANIQAYLGNSMHVFLLDLPRLEFGALIPKGDFVTAVLLGKDIDQKLMVSFLSTPEVRSCFPPDWSLPQDYCRCFPNINVGGPREPFGDRLVFIGDNGETRLYKDGIGGAYRTAKVAAKTAVFEGVSAEDFRRYYLPVCRMLAADNRIGRMVFSLTRLIQKLRFARKGILRIFSREQAREAATRLNGVLWDMFTGSAPYRDVFRRMVHPCLISRLAYETARGFFVPATGSPAPQSDGGGGDLGRIYQAGEAILRQGESAHAMYVIQSGRVEVSEENEGKELRLAELGEGEVFGEMALLDRESRSATVRAITEARVLTVDERTFLRKIHEDPSMAFRILQKMSQRIRQLDQEVARLSAARDSPAQGARSAAEDGN